MGSGKLSSKIIACPEPNLRGQAGTHAETREKGLTDRRILQLPFCALVTAAFLSPRNRSGRFSVSPTYRNGTL